MTTMLQTDIPVMEGEKKANLSKDAAAAALKPFKVLSVDSDADVLAFVRSHLEKEGLAVTSAGSGAEAIRVLEFGRVDLVIIDINVSGVDGLSLLRYVRGHFKDIEVMMTALSPTVPEAVLAIKGGAENLLVKPLRLMEAEAGGFLFIALVVIGLSAWGAYWLKAVGAELRS